jgi:hypothetical protein
MQIFTPAYKADVDSLLQWYHGRNAVYMRLPDKECDKMNFTYDNFGENLIFAFGDTIDGVISACKDMDVDIIQRAFASMPVFPPPCERKKIIIVEPWYIGTMHYDVQMTYPDAKIYSIGIPRVFTTNYGTKEQHNKEYGLDVDGLRKKITEFLNG